MTRSGSVAVATWARRRLPELLEDQGLSGIDEEPFEHDGWSGAELTLLRRGGDRFVLKRTSWARDWIARATRDRDIREAVVAADPFPFPAPLSNAYLGAAVDGDDAAILMPDLSAELIPWDRPVVPGSPDGAIDMATLDRVLAAIASLHALLQAELGAAPDGPRWPWCPLRERIELLTPAAARGYLADGLGFASRFLDGWAAFDRLAPAPAVALLADLHRDSSPLLAALARRPATALHGDLKLANVALRPDGSVALIDWQMTTFAPVAVDLGWFLVSNVSQLPLPPEAVFERYLGAWSGAGLDEPDAELDLSILVGLLLRGWRKGLDAAAAAVLPTGQAAAEDLHWWSERAIIAAERRL